MSEPYSLEKTIQWCRKPKKHFIGGAWLAQEEGKTFSPMNPSKREKLADIPVANSEIVNKAVLAARQEFEKQTWRNMPARERASWMRKIGEVTRTHAVELATIEALNNGKLFREALNDDLPDCGDIFDYYAGWTDKFYGETCPVDSGFINYTTKEPLGVCALIVPWNFPLLMAMWKIAPALATGNTVVIKPSEHTPLSLVRWFELVHEKLDLPAGLLNLILGDGSTGELLSRHMNINKIAFTGSTAVGKAIARASGETNLKSLSLELGGKSPNILFEDTPDLEKAIDRSFHLIFSQKGEKCSEPTRFIIHDSIHDAVVDALVQRAEKYILGDTFEANANQGAQNNVAHFEKILSYIEIGKQEGAELRTGGKAHTRLAPGLFVEPTIFTGVKSNMRIWNEEIFGPVLSIARFSTEEEAIRLANETDYGLAAGLWTKDVSRAHRVAQKLDAGMIFINRYGCYDFSSPFGGFKQSGWGKEMGIHSIESYTKTKSVWLAL
jgi:aldehyde dehydrogenase (NAD+)